MSDQVKAVDVLPEAYRTAFGAAADGMVLFDLKGSYREPNERACEILGYSESELRTVALRDLFAPGSYRAVLRAYLLLRRKGRTNLDVVCKRGSGRLVTVAVSASNAGYGQIITILRDVTAGRRQEEQLRAERELLQARLDAVPYPQAWFVGRRLASANQALRAMFPWVALNDGGPTLLQFFGKQNQDIARDLSRLLDRSDGPFMEKRSIRFRTPHGPRLDFDLTIDAAVRAGLKEACFTFVDTTPYQVAVREHEDAALHFKGLFESKAIAAAVIREGRYLIVNRGFLALLGFDAPGELIGQEFSASVASRDRKGVVHKLTEKVPPPGETLTFEFSALKKDRTQTRVDVICAPIDYEGQSAILLSCRDVGGTLKSTVEVRQRLDDLEAVERTAESVRHLLDPSAVVSVGLESAMHALGFEAGGVYLPSGDSTTLALSRQAGLTEPVITAIGIQNTLEGVTGFIARTLEPQVLMMSEYPAHLPYKSLFAAEHFETIVYLPLVSGEDLQGVLLLCTAKAREAEDFGRSLLPALGKALGSAVHTARLYSRMAESEQRYRSALEAVPDTVYVASPSGAFLLLSPQVEALTGFKVADFAVNPELWRNSLHPDDRAKYSERISNQHIGVDLHEMQYRILPKGKAEYRWIRDAHRFIRDSNGTVLSINGVVSDLTGRMGRSAGASVASWDMHDVLEGMQEGVLVLDRELRFAFLNNAVEQLAGISRDEVLGARVAELPAGHPMEALRPLLERALEGEHVSQEDLSISRHDEARYIWVRCSPVRDASGAILGVAGTVTDVTGRRNLEHELRESEETLRNVIDGMGDALMITDLQGKIWEVNREFSAITGFPRSEVLRMEFPYPWIVDEEMANFVAWIAALREKKSLRDFDMGWKRKDGRTVSISLSTTLLRTATGEPMAMLNLARDISERKQLANELSAKNRQIEMLNRIISKTNTRVDFGTIFDIIAVEVLNLVTYDQIDVTLLADDGRNVQLFACMSPGKTDLPVGASTPLERSLSTVAIAEKRPVVVGDISSDHRFSMDMFSPIPGLKSLISIPIILNDRILGSFNVAAGAENAFTGGELAILQPIADQIGALLDRTQLFQRVIDDSRYIHTLLNSIDSVVLTVDPELHIREANKAWKEFSQLLGLVGMGEESSITGHGAEEILRVEGLWEEIRPVVPHLIDQSLEYVTREFNLGPEGASRTFQLTVTPMLIGDNVTGLVFTITDITESKKTEAKIKQLYTEIQAQVERITTLYELGKGLSGAIDTRSLLEVVHSEAAKTIPFDLFTYDLFHEESRRFERMFAAGKDTGDARESGDVELPESVREVVLGGLSYMGEVGGDSSVMAVPVRSKQKILAVLGVRRNEPHSYSETHLRLLESIANLTGIAIDRATLFEDTIAKSREIENRNKELDDFTYVVSHDLKEPLITIEGYSKIVLKDYRERIDQEGQAYLSAVVQSTARMKSLIDDLLTLSRLGRLAGGPQSVSVKGILADLLHDFEFTLRQKNAVVEVPESLPDVRYDGTQLSMVFRNLISNAIKFNAGPEPRVRVGVVEQEKEFVFSVADNGIGIEKQHFEKIFVIFQRLHRAEEYTGTGAGLTIVRKIVERHHGRIWVESDVGKGTTFSFTVPK